MTFPAVTACNLGKYKKSIVSTVPTFANMVTVPRAERNNIYHCTSININIPTLRLQLYRQSILNQQWRVEKSEIHMEVSSVLVRNKMVRRHMKLLWANVAVMKHLMKRSITTL